MKARVHVFISGFVQGVFFRDYTRRWASSLGLTGWVKNLWDGRVEVVAEGGEEAIKTLLDRLKDGPPAARVEKVDVTWEEYRAEFTDFRIAWS